MRTVLTAAALGMLVALSGCALDDSLGGSEDNRKKMDDLYELTATDPTGSLQACHWMGDRLNGQQAAFFTVRSNEDLVVLSWGGAVICVDEPAVALRFGVIPVTRDDEPACSFCGTPLPAEAVIELAKKYTETHSEL